ncbi:hypothetical protein [Actinacidiphila epipremni]|uniref:hypothetical protein n=1 Tax=Actinacidiphila epipremni TaxID=2053013 RepID=UPI001F118ADC|nr:hypothetical protein [Actinacidiphila epipremni]
MSTAAIIAVVAAVIIVAAVVAALVLRGGGAGPNLKRRFGPEYERTLSLHDGDARATRRELGERLKRYRGIEPRELTAEESERYAARWRAVQGQFVDDPAGALGAADTLIADLAVDRGYPPADSPEHVDALSVHHPHQVQGYRDAHAATLAAGGGHRLDTEEQRTALVAARGLFTELLRSGTHRGAGTPDTADGTQAPTPAPEPERTAEPAAEQAPDPAEGPVPHDGAADGSKDGHKTLGRRFAALTERGRTEAHQ